MRRWLAIIPVLWLGAFSARAATVERINEGGDKLIVDLDGSELAALEVGRQVLVEFSAGHQIRVAVVEKLNPVKSIALLAFANSFASVGRGSGLRFVSPYWDSLFDPAFHSLAQAYPYRYTRVEGRVDYAQGTMAADPTGQPTTTSSYDAFIVGAQAYTPVYREWLGLGARFDRASATVTSETDAEGDGERTSTEMTVTQNKFVAGGWILVEPGWRLSLAYPLTVLSRNFGGDARELRYQYVLGRSKVGVTYASTWGELGLTYWGKEKQDAFDTIEGQEVARWELWDPKILAQMRLIHSPDFIQTVNLGYMFYQRQRGDDGDPLARKPQLAELIRARLQFEYRFTNGSRFNWALKYSGGRYRNASSLAREAKTGGISLGYRIPFGRYALGGRLFAEGGNARYDEDSSGEEGKVSHDAMEYGAAVTLNREFDLSDVR